MNRVSSPISRLALTAACLLTLTVACAPKDDNVGARKKTFDKKEEPVAQALEFNKKSVELARHALLQIARTYRDLDFAVGYKLDQRTKMNADQVISADNSSCVLFTKLAPSFDRTTDTGAVEILKRDYDGCKDFEMLYARPVEERAAKSSKLIGAETFTIAYEKDLPRNQNPTLAMSSVNSVTMDSPDMLIELASKSGVHASIYRSQNLRAVRVKSEEQFDTYAVDNTVRDVFTNDAKTAQAGRVIVELKGFTFKVSKVAPRRVVDLQLGKIEIFTESSAAGKSLDTSYELVPTEKFALPQSACVIANGKFELVPSSTGKRGAEPTKLTIDNASITDENGKPLSAKLCDQPDALTYMDEFEALFL